MKTLFCYDEKLGLAGCSVIYKGLVFTGVATCHPDDRDFMSERTGCFIAESRALIKCKQHIKKNEIEPGLAALRQAMSCMKQGKNYNPNSYEAKSLWK
jgi:hypothetical protein